MINKLQYDLSMILCYFLLPLCDSLRFLRLDTEANMLYAEALLYLDGASRYGESAQLVAQALAQTKRVQTEVLNALSHTWPLDIATHRFQD